MELSKFLILAAVLALGTAGLVILLLPGSAPIPAGAQRVPYLFVVGADPGFDLETDIFRLGQVPPGGSSSRSLTIEPSITSVTQENGTVRSARVYARGRGAEWITVDPAVTELPGVVKVTLTVPRGAEDDTYRGLLIVVPFDPEATE